jgi:hypothetical protein
MGESVSRQSWRKSSFPLVWSLFLLLSSAKGTKNCKWLSKPSHSHNLAHFKINVASDDCTLQQYLKVQEKSSIPHNQGWSYCQYCGFMTGTNYSGPEHTDLSWSQHSESFWTRHDFLKANFVISDVTIESVMISTPIFVVPMLCYQVGHLLIDFMEQMYSSMLEVYGLIRLDSVFVVSVAQVNQNAELQRILDRFVNSLDESSYGYMIHWLTNRPVISSEEFVSQLNTISAKMVFFSDIHFGGDISSTFMHLGTPHHPCQFQLNDLSLEPFSQNYNRFHSFISKCVSEMIKDPSVAQPVIDVLFIYRNSSRSIVNMKEMIDLVSVMNLNWLAVDFAVTPFKTQLLYLRKTRLLVAAAGTAMHNMIFMNHSTSAIVIMMEDWCHCSWQYANQGILLGIDVMTYCQPDDTEKHSPSLHWTSNFWSQCSVVTKHSEVTVDLSRFTSDLRRLFHSSPASFPDRNLWCEVGSVSSANYHRLPQFSFSEMKSTLADSKWSLELVAELRAPTLPQQTLKSFPRLSLCLLLYSSKSAKENPLCFTTDEFHSHTFLLIETLSPSLTLHSWGQLTPQGGKIRGSDSYLSLDLRVRNMISRALPQIGLTHSAEDCLQEMRLVCFVNGIELSLCVEEASLNSSFEISIQPIVREFCSRHKHDVFCPLLSSSLSHCVHQRVLESRLSLPRPQYLPRPAKPFVFLDSGMAEVSPVRV